MIYRLADRPICAEDLEPGSLVTIRASKNKVLEFFVIGLYRQDETHLFVEVLQIVSAETEKPFAYHLYAKKKVLLTRIKRYPLDTIETVQARLSNEIVNNIISKTDKIRIRMAEQKEKRKELRQNKAVLKQKRKLAKEKTKPYKFIPAPKGSTNTAWRGLKYSSEGYIHIYRG